MKLKKTILSSIAFVTVIGIAFSVQSFATPKPVATALSQKTKEFVKTRNRCTNSNCSCSGYWGYKHNNGTYEGACSNTDGHGHTCGHGPEKHGLRRW